MREVKNKKGKTVRGRKNSSGFTLVETILASVILCGAVLALGAISTRSLGQTKLNRQYEVAAALADRQLTLIDYIGVEDFIELGQTEGEFGAGDAFSNTSQNEKSNVGPRYRWEAVTEYRDIDNLYKVNITVSWVERNRRHSVSVDTMLNGKGMLVETGQE